MSGASEILALPERGGGGGSDFLVDLAKCTKAKFK